MINYQNANSEIFALFHVAWQASAASVVGYMPEVRWQGVQEREIPDGSKYWARLSVQTISAKQATLSADCGKPGQKRFTAFGLVFVQLFCPKSDNQAFAKGQQLAEVARNTFRGKATASNIWFRNVRINELSPEKLWERFNIIAEFEYDEIG